MPSRFERIHASSIKSELEQLIQQATQKEPLLAERLRRFARWIKDKKTGLLQSKRYVMDFLIELIVDSQFWLEFKAIPPEQKELFWQEAAMSPPERFWYETLFPRWFNEPDPKMATWTKRMMAGDFGQADAAVLERFLTAIESQGGNTFTCYILDLAMATDLLASGSFNHPLAIQITTQSAKWSEDKQTFWHQTLLYWKIERGIFLSYNPQNSIDEMAKLLLQYSDSLSRNCYNSI